MNRKLATGLAFTGLAVALGVGSVVLEKKSRVEAAADRVLGTQVKDAVKFISDFESASCCATSAVRTR